MIQDASGDRCSQNAIGNIRLERPPALTTSRYGWHHTRDREDSPPAIHPMPCRGSGTCRLPRKSFQRESPSGGSHAHYLHHPHPSAPRKDSEPASHRSCTRQSSRPSHALLQSVGYPRTSPSPARQDRALALARVLGCFPETSPAPPSAVHCGMARSIGSRFDGTS